MRANINYVDDPGPEGSRFTRERLLVDLDRPGRREIIVRLGFSHSESEKASQVLMTIGGEISPMD